jgi:hypothetical protein
MNRWKVETNTRTGTIVDGKPDDERARAQARQQHEADALYGLHNYVVLDSLLKRLLHLDKGFDL